MNALATPQQAGHLLVARRKTLGMSQAEVAKRLGISQSRYSELEAKPERITLERLMTLAALLNLEVVLQDKPATLPMSEW